MSKYIITDFKIGDEVYHLSNSKLNMVAVEIHKDANEVSCRWVDKDGISHCEEFMAEELGKKDDLKRNIRITAL